MGAVSLLSAGSHALSILDVCQIVRNDARTMSPGALSASRAARDDATGACSSEALPFTAHFGVTWNSATPNMGSGAILSFTVDNGATLPLDQAFLVGDMTSILASELNADQLCHDALRAATERIGWAKSAVVRVGGLSA